MIWIQRFRLMPILVWFWQELRSLKRNQMKFLKFVNLYSLHLYLHIPGKLSMVSRQEYKRVEVKLQMRKKVENNLLPKLTLMTLSYSISSLNYKSSKTQRTKMKPKTQSRNVSKIYNSGNPSNKTNLNYNCMPNFG